MSIAALYEIYTKHPLVSTDTRKILPGSIFFALKGGNFDGNKFAAQALAAGAVCAVVDDSSVAAGPGFFLVPDVLTALQELALMHRRQFSTPFLAITGSNGKTTTKELVAAVLAAKYSTYATQGNLNNHIGVPLTILAIPPHAQMAVIEMGANHQKEIESYCRIAEPTHGIITNCGKAHIEGFGGEEGVRKGKGELYDFIRHTGGTIFRNTTLPYLAEMAAGVATQVTYGTEAATYTGTPFMNGVFLSVRIGDTVIDTQLVGEYNYSNVMTAVAVGLHFGVPLADVVAAIEGYRPDNSRSQMLRRGTNSVILDAYNANPTSMAAAIRNFNASVTGHRILWLGGMREMGAAERSEYQELVALVSSMEWTDVILVGREFEGIDHPYRWFASSVDAAAWVLAHHPHDSTILIKGSRGSRMEVMLDALPLA